MKILINKNINEFSVKSCSCKLKTKNLFLKRIRLNYSNKFNRLRNRNLKLSNNKIIIQKKIKKELNLNRVKLKNYNYINKNVSKEFEFYIFNEKKVFKNNKLINKTSDLNKDFDNNSTDSIIENGIKNNYNHLKIN